MPREPPPAPPAARAAAGSCALGRLAEVLLHLRPCRVRQLADEGVDAALPPLSEIIGGRRGVLAASSRALLLSLLRELLSRLFCGCFAFLADGAAAQWACSGSFFFNFFAALSCRLGALAATATRRRSAAGQASAVGSGRGGGPFRLPQADGIVFAVATFRVRLAV